MEEINPFAEAHSREWASQKSIIPSAQLNGKLSVRVIQCLAVQQRTIDSPVFCHLVSSHPITTEEIKHFPT